MALWLEQGIPELDIVGLIPACYTFHIENRSLKYFSTDTIGTENVRENGGKKNLKSFGQLLLGTGSQRHMTEKF